MADGDTTFLAPSALLPEGWRTEVRITVDAHGRIAQVAYGPGNGVGEIRRLPGPVVPGVPNLHSHAFQRAMAGLAEVSLVGGGEDSFWSWRDVMYRFLAELSPEDVEAIAAQVYVEMLEAGYTTVGEFHYLHGDPKGHPYADPAEMSLRILQAARTTGIGLTHLPVLYMHGGFGGRPAGREQRRFVLDPDQALDLFVRLSGESRAHARERVGFAFHSLRAVPPEAMDHCVAVLAGEQNAPPLHIHVAEQSREVEECISWSGSRPVEWLLEHQPVSERWCLVHATHMSAGETHALARAQAVVGLCPSTEANLGDGFFPLEDFLLANGRLGIGSDSHVSVSPVEDLRWLEYGQRLRTRRRNVAGAVDGGSTATALFRRAVQGGSQALGQPVGAIAPGRRADLVVLDGDDPLLAQRKGQALLDTWIFAGNRPVVERVLVAGETVVEGGRHRAREPVARAYRAALSRLG